MKCSLCEAMFEGDGSLCPACTKNLEGANSITSGWTGRPLPEGKEPNKSAFQPRAYGREIWRLDTDGVSGLSLPISVAVHRSQVFVLDQPDAFRVMELDSDGIVVGDRLTIAFGSGRGEIDDPQGLCIDGQGRILIPDAGNDRISIWNPDGSFCRVLGGRGRGPGQLARPADVDVDDEGFIYVADTLNRRVQVFSPDGIVCTEISTIAGFGRLDQPVAITTDARKNIYVADGKHNVILKLAQDGDLVGRWPADGLSSITFEGPGDVRLATDGTLIVSDRRNLRVRRCSPSGKVEGQVEIVSEDDTPQEGGDIALLGEYVLIPDRWNDRVICMEFAAL